MLTGIGMTYPNPNQLNYNTFVIPEEEIDFVDSLSTVVLVTSDAAPGIDTNNCNKPMNDRCMYNSAGDCLTVAQLAGLDVTTECGHMTVAPVVYV